MIYLSNMRKTLKNMILRNTVAGNFFDSDIWAQNKFIFILYTPYKSLKS